MITIDQLLESVDLDFEPRFVTKSRNGYVEIWSDEPTVGATTWYHSSDDTIYQSICRLKLSEFANTRWTECIYEVPRKQDFFQNGKIEKLTGVLNGKRKIVFPSDVSQEDIMSKLHEVIDWINDNHKDFK